MPEKQNYNTKARKVILEYLESRGSNTVSAQDIISHLSDTGISVNPATVYRYLNKLTAEHSVLKFVEDETQVSFYQFIGKEKSCDRHIHIKCIKCGKLIHLNCSFMHDITEHLYTNHGFTLQCEKSILYGICRECEKINHTNPSNELVE